MRNFLKEKKMQSKCMLSVGDGGACCVTSYGLHLSATPLLRAQMMS